MAAEDPAQRRGLVRMKLFATGLLLLAAVVYLFARANEEHGGAWVGYVRAGAEAAMVGALADWFAVTALFRYPLGIPIPHTAIIPRRKDQIGRSLGEFVEGNFLTHEVLAERIGHARVAERLGTWLSRPASAARAGDAVADLLKGTLEVLDDKQFQEGLERVVRNRIDATPAAPWVGRIVEVSVEGGHHQRLLDAVLVGLRGFLEDNRGTFRRRLEQESPWWVPGPRDDRLFE